MLLNRFLGFILFFSLFTNLYSQKGKNGVKSVTVTASTTKVNEFTALTANANAGTQTITVAASSLNTNARFTSTLTPGDLVMIIQMQGALMKLSPVPVWAPDSTYGKVYSYENSGNYEFAEVKSVISATQIEINCGLTHSYTSTGKAQVVRVPRYSSLNVAASATLTTDAWNGTIGGILAVEVDGNTTINAGGLVSANALGFRGGTAVGNGGTGNSSWATINPNDGAEKGEGIGSQRLSNVAGTNDTLGKQCKGAPGNGGGGGDANNCGGGGGNGGNINAYNGCGMANITYSVAYNLEWPGRATVVSSGGGKGGYGTSTVVTNPNTYGPNNAIWSSNFKRPSFGGFGGRPLDYSTGKIFMGGGGGAGHMSTSQSNGAGACSGGIGGGIVYFLSYGTISGSGIISANGANGGNAFGSGFSTQGIDGAGGAGAGGTIILESAGSISAITANANGGRGGNQVISGATTEGQGPGGGGGGGYIASSNTGFTQSVLAGTSGTTNATAFDTEFPMNGATSGDVGTGSQVPVNTNTYVITATPVSTVLCTNQSVTYTATTNNPSASINWYTASAGGTAVASGTVYTTSFPAAGTYTIFAGSCPGLFRIPVATITVNVGPNITINSPTICPGTSTVITASGGSGSTTYTWVASGLHTNTISVTPASTNTYVLNISDAGCSASFSTVVTVTTAPTVTVTNASLCSGSSTVLTVGGANTYTWSPGGLNTNTISVNPSTTSTYIATGANLFGCTNTATAIVTVVQTPTLTAISPATICVGQVATFTVNGATTYTWNPGNITGVGNTFTLSPASSTSISVIGANGTCTTLATSGLTVNAIPSLTVANQSICPNQTATLSASGATTYSWNTGPTTNTLAVSPAITTTYVVTGTTNSCSSSKTVTVTVNSQPTLAVTGNTTICSGSSTTLTANGTGVTNYTWMPGAQTTSSVNLNPSSTQVYTITGSNGTCTNTITTTLSVTATPTISVPPATVCAGQTATLTASNATSYTWTPGGFVGSTYTINPGATQTISVIGSTGSCLSAAVITTVTVGSAASIAVPPATICPAQTVTLTASAATNYTWSTGSNTNTAVVSPTTTTTYSVAGIVGSCPGAGTVEVTVVPQPTIAITGNTNICSGNSTTLTANGTSTSYTWMPGNITNASASLNPGITTEYTVTGSNGYCSTAVTTTINVTTTPTLAVSPTTVCAAQTATLTVTGNAATYTWTPGNVSGTTFTINPGSSMTVAVTGANGSCTTSTTSSITVNSSFSIPIAGTTTICPNQTTTLTANGATTYTWNTGALTSSIAVSPTVTTTYTVDGTFGSCPGSNTVQVTVASQPTFAVTGNTAICSGNTATLTVNGTATNYTWMPVAQTTSVMTDNPVSTTIYTITGFDGLCTNTITTTVSVTAVPTLTAQTLSICTGQTATLTAAGASSYTWNPGNVTGTTYTISPATTATVTMLGANGTCTAQTTHTVNIGAALSVAINSVAICEGQSATLTATTSATSYTWSTGAFTNSISVSPASSAIYSVTVSNGSCSGSNTVAVTVNSVPTLTVPSFNICSGQTATLTVSGADTYTWSNSVNSSTQTVNPTSTTIYTVSGTSLAGCTNTALASATVNVTSVPNVSITSSPTICAGQSATLTAVGTATNYVWSTTQTTASIVVSPASLTNYTVTGDNGGCSASFTTNVYVTASPTLIASASNTSGCPALCVQFTDFTFPATSSITYNYGNGVTGNTNNPQYCYTVSGNYTVTVTASDPGLGCSSTYTIPTIINVTPAPIADFVIQEGNIVTVGSIVNVTNTSTNASNSAWDFGNGAISIFTNASTVYSDTGNYCINLLVTNGTCTSTATKCLDVIKETSINIPNVFTPNGDNSNEFFKISGSGIKSLECSIYDRWGLKLYEWSGLNGFWDGNVKSGAAPDGTYFYIINYTDVLDKSKTEKGFLNLFRE